MRLPKLGSRRSGAEPTSWSGPRLTTVVGASGGAGASTLCALLAGSVAEQTRTPGRVVGVIDGAISRSP